MGKQKRKPFIVRIVAFGHLNPLSKFNEEIRKAGGILVEVSSLEKMYRGQNTRGDFYRVRGNLTENYPKIPNSSRGIEQLRTGDLIYEKYAYIDTEKIRKKF